MKNKSHYQVNLSKKIKLNYSNELRDHVNRKYGEDIIMPYTAAMYSNNMQELNMNIIRIRKKNGNVEYHSHIDSDISYFSSDVLDDINNILFNDARQFVTQSITINFIVSSVIKYDICHSLAKTLVHKVGKPLKISFPGNGKTLNGEKTISIRVEPIRSY